MSGLASSRIVIYFLSMTSTHCRMARAGLGWSAKELAERAGVGYATVARFETGATIRPEVAERLEKVLAEAGAQFSQRSGRVGVTVPDDGKDK